MVAAGDHAKPAAGAFVNMGEPARVVFLVDQDIVLLAGAQAMAPDLHRAMVVVELDIIERFGIRAPHHRAVGLLDDIFKIRAARPVAHANCKVFRALDVSTPGFKPVIR